MPQMNAKLTLRSAAFDDGARIPRRHTQDGFDASPPLDISGLPEGTRELALLCEDPDAPDGTWAHWLLYRIDPNTTRIPAGLSRTARPALLESACQGTNSFGTLGYGGPIPPRGHGVHRYRFRLFALDWTVPLGAGAAWAGLESAMRGHILAEATLTGTYERT